MPGVIKINPDVMNDKRDALAVAWNEALRILMEDIGFTPEFQITPEQQSFLAGTAYADDPEAAAKTIVARIATFDTSIPNPTEEQVTETLRLLAMALELYGGQPDGQTLGRIKTELERVHGVEAPSGNTPPEAAPAPPEDPAREPPPEEGAPGTRDNERGGDVMDAAALRKLPRNPSRDQIWALSRAVAKVLPGKGNADRFLYETAAAESQWGTHPDTFKNQGGIFQLDRVGFDDTQATQDHRKNLNRHYATIKKAFGIDWPKVKYEEISGSPLLGALAARLLIANKEPPIPADVIGRAKYWKDHYNSHHPNADGTVAKFLTRNGLEVPEEYKDPPKKKK